MDVQLTIADGSGSYPVPNALDSMFPEGIRPGLVPYRILENDPFDHVVGAIERATALGGVADLEGLTFGPRLADGHASLVVVADDNFPTADSPTDRNQILVFEIMP